MCEDFRKNALHPRNGGAKRSGAEPCPGSSGKMAPLASAKPERLRSGVAGQARVNFIPIEALAPLAILSLDLGLHSARLAPRFMEPGTGSE